MERGLFYGGGFEGLVEHQRVGFELIVLFYEVNACDPA